MGPANTKVLFQRRRPLGSVNGCQCLAFADRVKDCTYLELFDVSRDTGLNDLSAALVLGNHTYCFQSGLHVRHTDDGGADTKVL